MISAPIWQGRPAFLITDLVTRNGRVPGSVHVSVSPSSSLAVRLPGGGGGGGTSIRAALENRLSRCVFTRYT